MHPVGLLARRVAVLRVAAPLILDLLRKEHPMSSKRFGIGLAPRRCRSNRGRWRPGVEALESRYAPSCSFNASTGVLTGTGNDAAEFRIFRPSTDIYCNNAFVASTTLLTLTFNHGGGSLLVNDSAYNGGDNYVYTYKSLYNITSIPSFGYQVSDQHYSDIESLSLKTGAGNDTITEMSPWEYQGQFMALNVDAGGGQNTLVADVSAGNDIWHYDITEAQLSSSWQGNYYTYITYTNIESVTLKLDDVSGNTVSVISTPAGGTTTINGGAGNDTIDVTPTSHNLKSLGYLSSLEINGGGGTDSLTVWDDANPDGDTYAILPSSVGRTDVQPISYTGVENLTVYAGTGGNEVNVYGTPAGMATTVNAGSGNDSVYAEPLNGDLGSLGGPLTVNGEAGNDALVVTDTDAPSNTYTLTATALARTGAPTITYGTLESVALYGSLGGSQYDIESTPDGGTTTVHGGPGNDAIEVTPTSHNLDSLGGDLTISGGGGTDSLILDDSAYLSNAIYFVEDTYTQRTDFDWRINYNGVENLTLDGGTGASSMYIDGTPAGSTTTVNGGPGQDTVNIAGFSHQLSNLGGPLSVDGGSGTNDMNAYDDFTTGTQTYTVTASTLTRTGAPTVTYANFGSLTLDTGAGNNATYIDSTAPGTTTVNGGPFDDSIYVTPTSENLADLGGSLTVDGGAGSDALSLWDISNPGDAIYTVTATSLSRAGVPAITYANLESVYFSMGSGTDVVNVEGTAAGTPLSIVAGAGHDSLIVTPTSENLDSLGAPVTLYGSTFQTLIIHDEQNASDATYEDLGYAVYRTNSQWVISGDVAKLVLDAGSGDNLINIEASQIDTVETVNGGAGNDTLVEGGTTGNLVGLLGRLTFNGGAGANALVVNDAKSATNNVYIGSPTSVSKLGGPVVTYSSVAAVTVNGGSGRDLMIAGASPMKLVGNDGEDILIGGFTNYDTNATALNALMAEWTRTDEVYQQRVRHITRGGGLNGNYKLNPATVHGNGGGNTLLGGGADKDLFFGSKTLDSTDWNPSNESFYSV
jgi:Ca2+-binding RTX toxin-like protein